MALEPDQPRRMVSQDENPILWALQQYQKIIRFWVAELTAIEFAVLMQIVDRTVGWQKTSRIIGVPAIINGGRYYRGIGGMVKRASVMNALRSLEDKGIITRQSTDEHSHHKLYTINLDWMPAERVIEAEPREINEEDYVPSLYDRYLDSLG